MNAKKISHFFTGLAFSFLIIQTACNDSSDVGNGLLDQDQLNVSLLDTFSIETVTVPEDSISVVTSTSTEASYPVGILDDPIFGKSEANLFFEISPFILPNNRFKPSSFQGATIDSMIMQLQYDSLSYGNLTTQRNINVFRVNETIAATVENIEKGNVFSTTSYKTFPTQLNTKSDFFAKIKPPVRNSNGEITTCNDCVSITAWYYNETKKIDTSTVVKLDPHLRIPLDKTLAEEIFKLDSNALNSNIEFRKKINGFHVKPISENSGMVNFKMTATNTANLLSNITIYYRDKDARKRTYVMYADAGTVKITNLKHVFSNTIKSAQNDKTLGENIVYQQGFAGSNVKVSLPTLKNLNKKGFIINKAELEFYAKNTNDGFDAAPQLLLKNESNGKINFLSDVSFGSQSSFKAFGGKPIATTENGENLNKYTFNLSYQVQHIIDGTKNASSTFYITNLQKNQRPYRTVLYGSKHPKYKPKLKVYYTKVN